MRDGDTGEGGSGMIQAVIDSRPGEAETPAYLHRHLLGGRRYSNRDRVVVAQYHQT